MHELNIRTWHPLSPAWLLPALTLAMLLGASCGGQQLIEGRPPFVGISGMRLSDEALNTDFRISNQNGVIMTLQSINLAVTVNGDALVRDDRAMQLEIDANSSEELQVRTVPDPDVRYLLTSLEKGDFKSLAFQLDGRVRTLEDGVLRFEQKGHLYPVPGRPGQFRSAVTQAVGLQREEQF